MRKILRLIIIIAITACVACGERKADTLPASSGKPFEVILTSNDSTAADLVGKALSKTCVGLPQDEPMFDVVRTGNGSIDTSTRVARAVVVIAIDSTLYDKVGLQYERDLYAEPQIVVSITARDNDMLQHDMPRTERWLSEQITRMEMDAAYKTLYRRNNPVAERNALSQMDVVTHIPGDLTSSKAGTNFLWLSNNAAEGMQNVCIYTYPGLDTTTPTFIAMRDSIMKENMPGEEPEMHMTTGKGSVGRRIVKEKDGERSCFVGLWEMEGDMMGGPFVAHALADTARKRVVVVEGFVYAPEQRKRNLIRRMEAVLFSTHVRRPIAHSPSSEKNI